MDVALSPKYTLIYDRWYCVSSRFCIFCFFVSAASRWRRSGLATTVMMLHYKHSLTQKLLRTWLLAGGLLPIPLSSDLLATRDLPRSALSSLSITTVKVGMLLLCSPKLVPPFSCNSHMLMQNVLKQFRMLRNSKGETVKALSHVVTLWCQATTSAQNMGSNYSGGQQ